MPTENARVVARKKVKLPSGDEINVPVIKQITFLDEVNRSQETRVTYDNSNINVKRVVDVVEIPSEGGGDTIKTEYIRNYTDKDEVNRSQETVRGFDNSGTPPPLKHFSVQYVRYFIDNDTSSNLYVDMQQILEYRDKDEVNRSQQTRFKITGWDTVGSTDPKKPANGFCDPTFPLLDYTTSNVIDPPWRFDPLQVLYNFSAATQMFLVGGNDVPDTSPHLLRLDEDGIITNPIFGGGALTGTVAPIDPSGSGYAVTSGDDSQVTNRYRKSTLLFTTEFDPICFDQAGNLFINNGTVLDTHGTVIRSGAWMENSFGAGVCDGDGSYYTIQQSSPGSTPLFLKKYTFKSGVSSWTKDFNSDQSPLARNIEIGSDGHVWVALIGSPSNDTVINKYSSVDGSLLKTLSFPHFDTHEYGADVVAGTNADPVLGNFILLGTFPVRSVNAWTVDRKGRVVVALATLPSGILSSWIQVGGIRDLRGFDSTYGSPAVLKVLTENNTEVWSKDISAPSRTTNYYTTVIEGVRATKNRVAITRWAGLSASAYLDGTSLVGGATIFDEYSYVTGFDNDGVEKWSRTGHRTGPSGFQFNTPYSGDIPIPVNSFPALFSSTPIFKTAAP